MLERPPEMGLKLDGPFDKSMIDIVILATAMTNYRWIGVNKDFCTTPRIYDGRRALSPKSMQESGWEYYGVGYPARCQTFSIIDCIQTRSWKPTHCASFFIQVKPVNSFC